MGYVTGYEHDVYISYVHIDDLPLDAEEGSVSALAGQLKKGLDKSLGCRDVSIWMDRGLTGYDTFPQKIEDTLRRSATLLVVASRSYLRSDRCARERNAFLKAVREKSSAGSRIFRVDLDRLNPGDFPSELHELLGYRFWMLDGNGNPRTFSLPAAHPESEYYAALNKLRIELAAELRRLSSLRTTEIAPIPIGPAIAPSPEGFGKPAPVKEGAILAGGVPHGDIFVSYASENREVATKLADGLRSVGLNVWFDHNVLQIGDDFNRNIRYAIERCALFMPVISREALSEKNRRRYFWREWNEADELARAMAPGEVFIIPVVVDESRIDRFALPEAFRRSHFKSLSAGALTPEIAEWLTRLVLDFRRRHPDA